MKKGLVNRFLNYVKINTQSNEDSDSFPSNPGELTLAKLLKKECENAGFNAEIDDFGYVYCDIPGSNPSLPAVGFIAHMDTAPDAPGKNVNPRIIENYEGKDIVLNKEKNIILKTSEFPCIKKYIGQDIIVTDGTTLLGADDKAGIAEIMEVVDYISAHPELKHGPIKIAFTPDEEIGRGMDKFNTKRFGAEYAYTIDGGEIGGFEVENFNAATATIKIKGESIHPGFAKGKMKNAVRITAEFIKLLPENESPEHTEGHEGFYHPYEIKGNTGETIIKLLIRDHDREKFEEKKKFLHDCINFLNKKYKRDIAEIKIKDSYYNMKEIIDAYPEIVKIAVEAIKKSGVTPKITPIRGGTDGARLSFMGIPTPNLFTGGHNEHSIFEYIPIQSMEKATEVIINIIKEFGDFEKYEK
jgi:tripeptide aminopeptidase